MFAGAQGECVGVVVVQEDLDVLGAAEGLVDETREVQRAASAVQRRGQLPRPISRSALSGEVFTSHHCVCAHAMRLPRSNPSTRRQVIPINSIEHSPEETHSRHKNEVPRKEIMQKEPAPKRARIEKARRHFACATLRTGLPRALSRPCPRGVLAGLAIPHRGKVPACIAVSSSP